MGRDGSNADGISSTVDSSSGDGVSTMSCPKPSPINPHVSVNASWFPSGWDENPLSQTKMTLTPPMPSLRPQLIPQLQLQLVHRPDSDRLNVGKEFRFRASVQGFGPHEFEQHFVDIW